jgi:Holliday junction resolvase RusA-like endonuclease
LKIELFIPGVVGVKQRPRFNKKSGSAYTPEQTINYENYIKMLYMQKENVFWETKTLEAKILAVFSIPKSYSKKRCLEALSGNLAPSTKDCDNIAKVVLDALNGLAYSDDRHICKLTIEKIYSNNIQQGVYLILQDYVKNLNNISESIKELKT